MLERLDQLVFGGVALVGEVRTEDAYNDNHDEDNADHDGGDNR